MQTKKAKNSALTRFIILIAVCLVGVVLISQQIDINKKNDEIKNLNIQIQEQQKKADELKEKEKLYATDEYVEQIAREELNLVNPDEKVFVDIGSN